MPGSIIELSFAQIWHQRLTDCRSEVGSEVSGGMNSERTAAMTTTTYSFGDYSVYLALDAKTPLGPLEDLHICHLGMRFISKHEIPLFSVYEFNMAVRSSPGNNPEVNVKCCGVVVGCEPENSGFRIAIHFSDLNKSDSTCLKDITKANKMRCDYCANVD